MTPRPPRIAMTPCARNQPYLDALARAGAEPVLLETPNLEGFDGLLLTGGKDIDPAHYGEAPDPTTEVDPPRDQFEIPLVEEAISRGLPIFGICRGVQLLNVALGGSLFQDLPHHPPTPKELRSQPAHPVRIAPDGKLAAIVGERLEVNSLHHQAVKDVAPGLRAVAWAEDGTVEALESPDHPVLGVQWHPEEMPDAPWSERLFSAFVSRCAPRAAAI
ncbi:MAG TPA: gamma-glutamyl-gamma-aminobutyrate hydrolase family protein [Candidatus Dormibacteraeota bacterium]